MPKSSQDCCRPDILPASNVSNLEAVERLWYDVRCTMYDVRCGVVGFLCFLFLSAHANVRNVRIRSQGYGSAVTRERQPEQSSQRGPQTASCGFGLWQACWSQVASCFHIFRLIFDEMISFDILMDMVFGFLHIWELDLPINAHEQGKPVKSLCKVGICKRPERICEAWTLWFLLRKQGLDQQCDLRVFSGFVKTAGVAWHTGGEHKMYMILYDFTCYLTSSYITLLEKNRSSTSSPRTGCGEAATETHQTHQKHHHTRITKKNLSNKSFLSSNS